MKAAAQPITLVSLATHISGLPRDDHVKAQLTEGQAAEARLQWLAQQPGLFPPGRQAQYSNAAYDLLGDVLARASHASYADQLTATITRPLGMVDTTASPTAEECARMLAPYPGRRPFPCQDQLRRGGERRALLHRGRHGAVAEGAAGAGRGDR